MTQESSEIQTSRASLELLYHISRELASDLDLRIVLERILFLAMRYSKAIRGSIIVMDKQGRPIESAVIAGGEIMDRSTQRLRSTLDHGLAGWVVRNKEPALVLDTSHDERWMFLTYENLQESVEAKSAVSAPLLVREQLVGVMTLVHPKPNYFTHDHLTLVQTIADQAGILVQNARLYSESQRQVRVMTALAETAATITASLNLEEVFMRILDQIWAALSVQAVCLALVDPEKEEIVVRAAKGWLTKQPVKASIRYGQGIAGFVAKEGKALIVNDAPNDKRYDIETHTRTGLMIQAIACAPLKYRGQIIGIVEAINPKDGNFDSEALLLLTGIGSLAGTAVRHAQLFERLQAAHQSYRELFDDSVDLILISDWDGKIIEVNRKALLLSGYDKEALRAMSIQRLHTVDFDLVGEQFEKITSELTVSYESRLRSLGGYDIPIQVNVRRVNIEGNQLVQWIFRDITEIKNLDNLREDLTSMIYHDLRSPLANIVSSLEIINTVTAGADDTIPSLVSIALRSTERIQRLTNSLLDISRLEAGQPVGNRQPCQSLPILNEAFDLVKPIAENKQQQIKIQLPETLPVIYADADMIRRVVVNLLENATKYSPSGSIIHLEAKTDGEWLIIGVQDNGPGIPISEHERIFDKFTRIGGRGVSSKGLGLGLAYCRLAVEAHQGQIWLDSELGKGSRFTFKIPLFEIKEAFFTKS